MNWTKGPNPADAAGSAYYSASCIVWRQDNAPICRYIIRRVVFGKGYRWMLYQWQADSAKYTPVPCEEQQPYFARLFHAQSKAVWLEQKNARAGLKPDHSSPIEAAAAEFAACFGQSEEDQS